MRAPDFMHRAGLQYRSIASQDGVAESIESALRRGFHQPVWTAAWKDKLEEFKASGYDVASLVPKFVAESPVLRYRGEYIEPLTAGFELRFFEAVRDWLFETYFYDVPKMYEFGSGSAFNSVAFCQKYPEKECMALDFAPEAVSIASLLSVYRLKNISGRLFDFTKPDYSLELDGGVLTVCALEQVGREFEPFLQYLLDKKPRRVVHVEPTVELYGDGRYDGLAAEYHRQRGYLEGLMPRLDELALLGKIKIVHRERLGFGSKFHECYTVQVWEPVNTWPYATR
jgi:hypothetical protein